MGRHNHWRRCSHHLRHLYPRWKARAPPQRLPRLPEEKRCRQSTTHPQNQTWSMRRNRRWRRKQRQRRKKLGVFSTARSVKLRSTRRRSWRLITVVSHQCIHSLRQGLKPLYEGGVYLLDFMFFLSKHWLSMFLNPFCVISSTNTPTSVLKIFTWWVSVQWRGFFTLLSSLSSYIRWI